MLRLKENFIPRKGHTSYLFIHRHPFHYWIVHFANFLKHLSEIENVPAICSEVWPRLCSLDICMFQAPWFQVDESWYS